MNQNEHISLSMNKKEFVLHIFEEFLHLKLYCFQPENIMLLDKHATNPDIKIIDFGMAQRFIQGEEYRSLGGTPQYIGESTFQTLIPKEIHNWYVKLNSLNASDWKHLQMHKCKYKMWFWVQVNVLILVQKHPPTHVHLKRLEPFSTVFRYCTKITNLKGAIWQIYGMKLETTF